jgi:hypothetical protein
MRLAVILLSDDNVKEGRERGAFLDEAVWKREKAASPLDVFPPPYP